VLPGGDGGPRSELSGASATCGELIAGSGVGACVIGSSNNRGDAVPPGVIAHVVWASSLPTPPIVSNDTSGILTEPSPVSRENVSGVLTDSISAIAVLKPSRATTTPTLQNIRNAFITSSKKGKGNF
jgi:hypothetical protein